MPFVDYLLFAVFKSIYVPETTSSSVDDIFSAHSDASAEFLFNYRDSNKRIYSIPLKGGGGKKE